MLNKRMFVVAVLILGIGSAVAQAQLVLGNTLKFIQTDTTPLRRFGPTDPVDGYPLWVEDSTGLVLEKCLDTTVIPAPPGGGGGPVGCPVCLDPNIDLPNAALPVSFPTNYPQEAFYMLATAIMDTTGGGSARIDIALEAAFDGLGIVEPGEQVVFSRIRIRVDNAQGGQKYTITHPYGVIEITPQGGGLRSINITKDIFLWKGVPLKDPLISNFGTFLRAVNPLPGFVGNACADTTVTGSPFGTNFFRIEGPGIGAANSPFLSPDITLGPDPLAFTDSIETPLFQGIAKAAGNVGLGVQRATYQRDAVATQVDVWAASGNAAVLEVSAPGIPATPMVGDGAGNFYAHFVLSSATPVPAAVTVTNVTDNPPFVKQAPLVDQVAISQAIYNLDASTVSIAALSSSVDAAGSLSTGTGAALGPTNSLSLLGVQVPPINVTVNSPFGGSLTLPTTIIATVATPLANGGGDQIALLGSPITLDGSGSTGLITSYSWLQTGGPTVVLTGAATPIASFVFPAASAQLTFQLTVTGPTGSNAATVTVTNTSIANAGPDQTFTAFPTLPVQLNGSLSAGAGLNFNWSQIAGATAILSNPNIANPTFAFPLAGGTVTFALTVSGPGGTSTDTVNIIAPAGIPVADAGQPQTVIINDVVQLDGGASQGAITTYNWTQLSGNAVSLGVLQPGGAIDFAGNLSIPNPVFVFPNIPQTITFQLIVTGPGGVSAASTVDITAGSPFTPDTITIDPNKAQFGLAKGDWKIEGISSQMSGQTITVYLGAPIAANLIGSGVVDPGGKFKVQCPGPCPDPTATGGPQTLTAISTLGGVATDIGFSVK